MWASEIVKGDPVADRTARVLQALRSIPVNALLFQSSDDPFDHAVLFRCVRCDELLTQAVASDQPGEAATGEDQAIIGSQYERCWYTAQRAESGNQSLFQCGLGRPGFATSG